MDKTLRGALETEGKEKDRMNSNRSGDVVELEDVPGFVFSVLLVLVLVCIVTLLSVTRHLAAFSPASVGFTQMSTSALARADSPL